MAKNMKGVVQFADLDLEQELDYLSDIEQKNLDQDQQIGHSVSRSKLVW